MSQWIPIETPPKESGTYLCYVPGAFAADQLPHIALLTFDPAVGFVTYTEYIQHWMPCPKPPQSY